MSIEQLVVTEAEVEVLLRLPEGHFLDLKAIEIAPAKLTKGMSAFANADGGELYVGIDEVGGKLLWRGFGNQEDANGHLQAFERLFPLGQDFGYEFLTAEGQAGQILHISIQKTRDIKYASDGKPYIRRGAQSLPVISPEDIDRLSRAKGLSSFETQPVNVPLDFVSNSEAVIGFMLDIVPSAEPVTWLRKQLLVVDEKPTVAAVLLFSDEPQAALPKRSAIKIYRYKTTDLEGKRENLAFDPITIEGCLYIQITAAVKRTTEVVQESQVSGPEGLQQIAYPHETLHEIITNAVLHRDYAIADDVHVRIFDNRIEVESPGRLPAHVTAENILSERFARNGVIVRLINKYVDAPNKDVGEGLNTAFAAMKALKLKDPLISELANSVLVNIRHERLGSPEQLIMEHLTSHDEINNRTVRELTGIGSENKVKTVFQGLMRNKQIERVPGKAGASAAYQKYSGVQAVEPD